MATSGSNRLVEEINDQFLICKICYDVYTEPKTLSCLHTFCCSCLERHQEAALERSYRYLLYSRAITCPICRKKTDLPVGGVRRLPDNFLVANLADIVNRRHLKDGVQRCEICQIDDVSRSGAVGAVAVAKCLDCAKLLCRSCRDLHRRTKVTQSHGVFDIDAEKDIQCKVHQDEVVRFYCEPCEICVCVVCTFQEHKGHEVTSFTEGIEKYGHSLDELLVACRRRIGQLRDQLRMIDQCEADLKRTEERITEVAIESISAIRKKEREMVRDLYLAYGEESIDFIKEKDFIRESVDSLQTTCNLTEMILKDRSVELLLLKKEIQQKLNLLLQRKWLCPPDVVRQRVEFVPGRPELGYLKIGDSGEPEADSDKNSSDDRGRSVMCSSINTQTPVVQKNDTSTSMGVSVLDLGHERVTQTEAMLRRERGTETDPDPGKPATATACTLAVPDSVDRQTMTVGTPTMKRKIQTEHVTYADRETNTALDRRLVLEHVASNTDATDTADRSTMTKILRHRDQMTCTDQLVTTADSDTLTDDVTTSTRATETSLPVTQNRGTLTARPFSCDKKISTARVIVRSDETNTPHVTSRDAAVTARMYGRDVGVTTRTTITTNTGTGDDDVTAIGARDVSSSRSAPTADKETSCRVVCADSADMTDVTRTSDQTTFTSFFNMADKVTETERKSCRSADTNTDVIGHEDKAVHVDERVKVEMLDDVCQTIISIIDAVLWPSLMPVHVGTNTEHVQLADQASSTEQPTRDAIGTNTDRVGTADVGIGHASCATSDKASDATCQDLRTRDAYAETETTPVADVASCTSSVYTSDFGTATERVLTKDSYHDAFTGYLSDVGTNTNPDVTVKSVVPLSDTSTNTSTVLTADSGTHAGVPTKDAQAETTPIAYASCSSNTDARTTVHSATTMGGGACTEHAYVNTVRIELASVGSGDADVRVTDGATGTDPLEVATRQTETDRRQMVSVPTATDEPMTVDVGVYSHVDLTVTGTDALSVDVRHQETSTEATFQSTIGVGTTSVRTSSKAVGTVRAENRDFGAYTRVQSVDKATYMPQPIAVTTGTCTTVMYTSDKGSCTELVQLYDRATNTAPTRLRTGETTMYSEMETLDRDVNTDSVTMVDCQNDPIAVPRDAKYTNTVRLELCTTGVGTPEVFTLSTGTTTQHRVSCTDRAMLTESQDVRDQSTDAPYPDTNDRQTEAKPEVTSIGVLKRPHTISRGAGSLYVELCTTSTSPDLPYVVDRGTTVHVETENRSTSGVPFQMADRSTETLVPERVERFTEMARVLREERASSPIRDIYVERSCSPVCVHSRSDRETSPVSWPVSDKATTAKPAAADGYTSTAKIDLRCQSTGMPPVYLSDRACSPGPILPEVVTVHRATSMLRVVQKDEATAAEPDSVAVAVNTSTPRLVDRACTPVRTTVCERATSAIVETVDKRAGTPHVSTLEKSTWKKPTTAHSGTSMPQVSYSEKETCTPRVHVLHKNTWTENMTTSDKQTNTISDVTSAYRRSVHGAERPVTVSRGTCTPPTTSSAGESPPPGSERRTADRATSPVRTVTVDRAVSAKRGEILEPIDTYQSAGGSTRPRKSRPRPRLASIEEDSSEWSHESADDENARTMSPLLFPPLTPVGRRAPRPRMSISGILHKERLLPSTPRMGKMAVSAFNSETRSSSTPIVCKVDVATNTRDVATETRATCTEMGSTSEKGVSTEFLPMEGRMAECISKLKTVRNRLEQKQPCPSGETAGAGVWTSPTLQRAGRRPTLGIAMRSKSLGDCLNEHEMCRFGSQSPLNTSGSSDGGSSHGDSDEKVSGCRQKARKQRLDINQLLRSSSLPEADGSPPHTPLAPSPLTKPKIRAVYPQVIPKLNIDDFKLKTSSKDGTKRSSSRPSSASRKPSPKRRSASQNNEPKKQKDREGPATVSSAGGPPPDPPKRSSSLKHALLTAKMAEGTHGKKDDSHHQK